MKSSDLNSFLNNRSSVEQFQKIIQKEVSSYSTSMSKIGSNVPLHFYEDQEIVIDNTATQKLLNEVIAGNLDNITLAYICDCLSLGEMVTFSNDNVHDIVSAIADPEINGGFKSDPDLKQLMERL